mmetsp:Transcript_120159/g.375703  ORF Transcript_120159/g.375703 Transcript_120159/m.375703 type:complete len:578 (+) Transcript_120159:56-1789(+)
MEVLTLQLGHFANHVGAHFWNFQDETAALEESAASDEDAMQTDFSRLHSWAEHRGGGSWRPRLVLVDKRGALCAARWDSDVQPPEDGLGPGAPGELWDHGTVGHRAEHLEAHPFQRDLEAEALARGAEEVEEAGGASCGTSSTPDLRSTAAYHFRETARSWTDYLKVQLPATCVHELQGWHHGVAPFATFFDGLEVQGCKDEEAILDLVRRQFELCDQLDAVHAVFDMHNGFSGLADVVLRWVHEEQPKCGKFVMAVLPDISMGDPVEPSVCPQIPDVDAARPPMVAAQDTETCAWVSAAFSFANLLSVGMDAWIPLAVPLWTAHRPRALAKLDYRSPYESSALLAAALETATLPYRLLSSPRPSAFLAGLAPAHRPACGLLQALPLPGQGHATEGAGGALAALGPHFLDLAATPARPQNPHTSLVLRGASPRRLVALCQALPPQARRMSFAHPAPLPLPLPFPQAFGPEVSRQGLLACRGEVARPAGAEVESCPTATQLHAAAHAGRCAPLGRMACTLRAHRRSAWAAMARARYGVEADEFCEVLEAVTEHLECGAASSEDEAEGSSCSHQSSRYA